MANMNPIIHQSVRLRIMAALTALDANEQVEFTYMLALLKLTHGNLGAHLHKLENAGYIAMEKTFVDRKPRTYIAVTAFGQHAFAEHVATLAMILEGGESFTDPEK